MQDWIFQIKKMFQSMHLGEISISPYDTAWIAMVPSLDGSNSSQFPKCINWIIDNQLPDGSWGDEKNVFLAYDRVSSTLACVIALKTWNIGHANVVKGILMYAFYTNFEVATNFHSFNIFVKVSLDSQKCFFRLCPSTY
ncbi:hypothetical protein GOP47_0014311 [Adiantum capillus-veneris]|uniref:Uncharacterized protein n=1 Tax=Adiantum capillus-veneris TaxID=13818 RepID=A0A9D4ZC05_ADICA|nr:hypothetical protein GOP47_0014311 [Adiantum capillus-veneris]